MTRPNFWRQLDILDPAQIVYPVTIIGVGGIGSPLAWILAKMGCPRITLYDPDTVEAHNLPNQFFRLGDVGRPKVEAVRDAILEFTDCEVVAVQELFKDQDVEGIVISGVDSMQSRNDIWARVRFNMKVPLYIDGRMGGEILQLYVVRPSQLTDIQLYEPHLFSDDEASPLPCSAQSVIYTVIVLGGFIASQLKKWIVQEQPAHEITFDLVTLTLVIDGSVAR